MHVRFLGTGAANPSSKRGFSCIGVVTPRAGGEDVVLLDCGDGSVGRILQARMSINSISNILITHFHSDHLSGLPQVVETMGIERREQDLNIFGPAGLSDYFSFIQKVTNVAATRKFHVRINEVEPKQKVQIGNFSVRTFEMTHTLPCIGYRLESEGLSIAYTGDTEPCEGSRALSERVDLLIHEATYLAKDTEKARDAKHSTPGEAADTARHSEARNLILTHVNDSAESEDKMIDEARRFFQRVSVAQDGLEVPVS